jgi:hypothetical protein
MFFELTVRFWLSTVDNSQHLVKLHLLPIGLQSQNNSRKLIGTVTMSDTKPSNQEIEREQERKLKEKLGGETKNLTDGKKKHPAFLKV